MQSPTQPLLPCSSSRASTSLSHRSRHWTAIWWFYPKGLISCPILLKDVLVATPAGPSSASWSKPTGMYSRGVRRQRTGNSMTAPTSARSGTLREESCFYCLRNIGASILNLLFLHLCSLVAKSLVMLNSSRCLAEAVDQEVCVMECSTSILERMKHNSGRESRWLISARLLTTSPCSKRSVTCLRRILRKTKRGKARL